MKKRSVEALLLCAALAMTITNARPLSVYAASENEENGVDDTAVYSAEPTENDKISGECGENAGEVTWSLEYGRLNIISNGVCKMASYDSEEKVPWAQYRDDIRTVDIIGGELQNIGAFAFADCVNLEKVYFSDSISEIGDNAFSGCTSLQNMYIPDGTTRIGKAAFYEDVKLGEVYLPESLKEIGESAFGCNNGEISAMRLMDVYYGGTKEQWDAFTANGLKKDNDLLTNEGARNRYGANRYFNCDLSLNRTMIKSVTPENDGLKICWNDTYAEAPENYHIYVNNYWDKELDGENGQWESGTPQWIEAGCVSGKKNEYVYDIENAKPGDYYQFRISYDLNGKQSALGSYYSFRIPSSGPCDAVCLSKNEITLGRDQTAKLEAYFPEDPDNTIVSWESSDPQIVAVHVSEDRLSAVLVGLQYGTAKVTVVSATGSSAECIVTIPEHICRYGNTFEIGEATEGTAKVDEDHTLKLLSDANGNFTDAMILGADGNIDKDIDHYVANIVTKRDSDGIASEFYSLVFTDGKWDTSYDSEIRGAYEYDYESYMVAGGVINQNANGLQFTGDAAGWKFLAAGRVVRDRAGLVMYQDKWFWIDDEGSCDQEYAAIVKWSDADFLVHGGRLRTDFTGFTYDPQKPDQWYHITNGQVWGDGEITDQSIEGSEITRNVVSGVVQ